MSNAVDITCPDCQKHFTLRLLQNDDTRRTAVMISCEHGCDRFFRCCITEPFPLTHGALESYVELVKLRVGDPCQKTSEL